MSDQEHQTQGRPQFMRQAILVLLLLSVGFGVSACGKKPSKLDPPLGVEDDTFPRTYPDTNTDPAPTVDAQPGLLIKPTYKPNP